MEIYRHDQNPLGDLLARAGSPEGATLLIPDLQRPYRWTPNQVVLLVDSLIKGWPFGTLLLWSVTNDQARQIPFRTFWTIVDRTEGESTGVALGHKEEPAKYHMVLDGQQRLQSLLLAVGPGDGWGFKLLDRHWRELTGSKTVRGRVAQHWSLGQLCLDLHGFGQAYEAAHAEHGEEGGVLDLDYRDALAWVVRSQKGLSTGRVPANYQRPLPNAVDAPGRYVRFSRFWDLAQMGHQDFKWYRARVQKLLEEHGVSADERGKLTEPLTELVQRLEDVKKANVGILELVTYQADWFKSRDRYDEAVVNIFTRLNQGGTVLTPQEITFAWIKRKWEAAKTDGRNAETCFSELRDLLKDAGIAFDDIDELVRSMSVVWAVLDHKGALLATKDFLDGRVVGEMAADLVQRWAGLKNEFVLVAEMIRDLQLEYGRHFESLNSVILLLAWRLIGTEWATGRKLKPTEADSFRKSLDEVFEQYAARWILLSQWAGRWGASSGKVMAAYASQLAKEWETIRVQMTALRGSRGGPLDAQLG